MKASHSLSSLLGTCILLAIGLFIMPIASSYAAVPQLINYQGKLTKVSGAPLDTTISMVFTIYADSNGTISKWSESQSSVKVEKGVFNVLLGSVNVIPDSVFDGSISYLGVKVGGDPEITPRKPMVSVGYAYNADMVDETHSSDFVKTTGDQSINGTKTFSSIPVLPASDPTADNQAARKAYVDAKSGTCWRHLGTQVFSGAITSSWTDLNLSSYIGANYAFVMLKIKLISGNAEIKFRTNGDTENVGVDASSYYGPGVSGATMALEGICYIVVETDSNGIVEYRSLGDSNCIVTLTGYVK